MSVGIMAVRKCKQLAEEYNKRDWIPLFKVWAVMQLYGYADGNAQKLVPCLDTEGVPCMFDLVSQKPFYNAGTGSFTWG